MSDVAGRFDQLFRDDSYLELKNQLFSYTLRRRHVRRLLNRSNGILLDVGSGISPIAPGCRDTLNADVGAEALRVLSQREREAAVAVADAVRLPFRDSSVAAVVCSEVLEHIDQDVVALQEFHRVLTPGGTLTITFPIHPYYYTFDDEYVGHFRRYRLPDMLARLQDLGFQGCKVRKVAGFLEKLATYLMVRGFSLMSSEPDHQGDGGPPWWGVPYRLFNAVWSRLCAVEAAIEPMPLITIVSVQCRKG